MRIRSRGMFPRLAMRSASVQSGGKTLWTVAAGGGAVADGATDAGGEATVAMIGSPMEKCTPLIVEREAITVKMRKS